MDTQSRRLVVVLVAVVTAVGAFVVVLHPWRTHTAQKPRPDLQRLLDTFARTNGVAPGVTAYVAAPKGTWSGAAGLADVAQKTPMPRDARMRLESVSKAWTATLILQLAGDGKLHLDDTVARWLPGLLPYGDRITIRQLLNHTSGLIDNNDISANPQAYLVQVRDAKLRAKLVATEQAFAKNRNLEFSPRLWIEFAAALPLQTTPGTTYHYSNIGYEIAGLVAEKVSGTPLERLYRERIVDPLHLKSAAYDPQGPISGEHPILYHVYADGRRVDGTDSHGGIGAEGGIVSDARDEATFLQGLFGGELLKPAQLTQLKQAPWQIKSAYALGFVAGSDPCGGAGLVYTHGGGGPGTKTSVISSGDGNRVAVVLANGYRENDNAYYTALDVLAQRLYCAA